MCRIHGYFLCFNEWCGGGRTRWNQVSGMQPLRAKCPLYVHLTMLSVTCLRPSVKRSPIWGGKTSFVTCKHRYCMGRETSSQIRPYGLISVTPRRRTWVSVTVHTPTPMQTTATDAMTRCVALCPSSRNSSRSTAGATAILVIV